MKRYSPVWLHNLLARLYERLNVATVLMRNDDGRLMPLDEWEGYDTCMRPGCAHYRCEHSFGTEWTTVYVNPEAETTARVGDRVQWPEGCMNGGCKCGGFWTARDLITYILKLGSARVNGSWDMSQVPGVTHVESAVDISVRITTYTESHEATAREVIYIEEDTLRQKHPSVLFDFGTRWDKPPED